MKQISRRIFNFLVFTSNHKKRVEISGVSILAYDLKSARKKVKKNWARRPKAPHVPKNPKFKLRLDQ